MTSTPPAADRALMDFAVRLMLDAGNLSAERFFAEIPATRKDDGTEVTAADVEVERFVRGELERAFPADTVMGEEEGEAAGSSGRRWVVDPISGTAFFSRRMPLYANLLAFEDEHGPAVGIVNLPVQKELVFAGRGLGCHRLISPSRRTLACAVGREPVEPGAALVLAMNQQTWPTPLVTRLHEAAGLVGAINHPVVHVVTGRVDAAVMTGQGYDDLAPLPVIVAEAGGHISDLTGAEVLGGDGSVLVTGDRRLHDELLAVVAGERRAD